MRRRVFEVLEGRARSRAGRAFVAFIVSLILLNAAAAMLETVRTVDARYGEALDAFGTLSVGIFTAEYLLRVWSCTASPAYSRPVLGRLRFMLTPLALVDLFAILPFYLSFLFAADLRSLRLLRLLWLSRLLKVDRYSESFAMLWRVVRRQREELVITLTLGAVLLVISSTLMYFVEREAQPRAFSSIPAAMWWAVQTLTTVGYGDVYPTTPLGKLLGGVVATLGVGMFALPAGILGSGLMDEIRRNREDGRTCPHCGGPLEGPPQDPP